MKKYNFLKYFIKNRVFAVGGWAGLGDPSPLGSGLVFNFYPQFSLGTEVGVWKQGRGRGCLNLPPIRPVAMSI